MNKTKPLPPVLELIFGIAHSFLDDPSTVDDELKSIGLDLDPDRLDKSRVAFEAWIESLPLGPPPDECVGIAFHERSQDAFTFAASPDEAAQESQLNGLLTALQGAGIDQRYVTVKFFNIHTSFSWAK